MKRKILYCLLTISMLLFTACGKNDNKNTTEQTTVETVQYQPATGTDAITTAEVPKDEEGFYPVDDYVITVGDTINVRVSPSKDANIYSLLAGGEILKRTGYNEEWTRVFIDNTSFYIHSDLVEVTDQRPENEPEVSEDTTEEEVPKLEKIVIIDPANQTNPNVSQDPIGPGSEETKQGATSGYTGATFDSKEYELNLIYAEALKAELESRGYTVSLTRTENEVDLTNKARADIANSSGATTFIRIQMSYSSNTELTGVMAVIMPSDSPYNASLYGDSKELATRILQGMTAKTGAVNHGIYETDQYTTINWSQLPVAVINLGYLSNAQDEQNLMDENYRNDIVKGIADGLDYFYN